MKIFFNQPAFDSQLLRALSYTVNGAADIGECLSTATRITNNGFDEWHQEWCRTAERLAKVGKAAEAHGHHVSAHEAFLRASNYYRAALFFLYGDPVDPLLVEGYEKHVNLFAKAMKLSDVSVEEVSIPFEGGSIRGNFYACSNDVRPVIIANGGYDSTHQEMYYAIVPAALRRGYHVIAFDGPGQGEMLIKQRVPMRHNWETVITPIVDYLGTRNDVDHKKIALLGQSWGGMLAPRAAAFERRIAALIANPGQFDALENLNRAFKGEDSKSDVPNVDAFIQAAMSDKFVGAKFRSKMFIHGIQSPTELVSEWAKYTLAGIAEKIECPTLICDAENESLSAGQAEKLFDVLNCPKEYLLFTNYEGAGEHCAGGAVSLFSQRAFDWLDHIFAYEPLQQAAIPLGYSS
ncbi:MAG: alpha/beta fold hydrolase [Chlamydiales bacterium]|nr:alpha/beta fold hydrolase [Chlamydiia bacterium]MCP5507675.1 alpha/beta fold hydrolase [Chlamydiales bacterium]